MPEENHDPVTVKLPAPDWIGDALGITIRDLEARVLGEGRGLQSTTWRLQLDCEPRDDGPTSVILKSETADEEFNAFSRLHNAFEREVGVYTHCTPQLENHRPSVYACQGGSPSWLLMEDLSHLRSGDQVIGLSFEETLATVQQMGAIHARFWLNPELSGHAWLPRHGFWFADPREEFFEDFFRTYGVRFGPEVCRLYRAVLEQTAAIDAALDHRPWTLVHGDLRADNLLFDRGVEDPDSVIIDWSWASRSLGAIDIAFLIGGSTPQVQRLGRHEQLLEAWHRTLLEHGVSDYSLAEARRDLQLASLRCITTGVAMHSFSSGPDTPVRVALFMDDAIQRHAAYALEIEAWQALPDPSGFPIG
ncbi:MAG: phosphotransferase [Synechococcaceae cyanobacterium]|nr:phosphotransferase [Synechococcaceae cyanobacterium]